MPTYKTPYIKYQPIIVPRKYDFSIIFGLLG